MSLALEMGMASDLLLSVASAIIVMAVCGWAASPASAQSGASPARTALEVSAVVSPTCRVSTSPEPSAKPVSLACSRGALPAGHAPRTEVVPAVPMVAGSAAAAAGPSAPVGQNPILSIHF